MNNFYQSNKNYNKVLAEIDTSGEISEKNKRIVGGFLTSLQAENISPQRIKKYLTCLRNILKGMNTSMDKFGKKEFEKIMAGINGRNLATSTKDDYSTTLKKIMKHIHGVEWSSKPFPCLKASSKKARRKKIEKSQLLTDDDVNRIIAATDSVMYKALIAIAFDSGARPSEILTLNVGSVELEEGYTRINIRESKTDVRSVVVIDADRYIKMWLQIHPYRNDLNSPLFLTSGKLKFLDPSAYNVTLKRIVKKANLKKHVWAYLFRHSAITRCLNDGWSETMVKKRFGHGTDSKELITYEHLVSEQIDTYALNMHKQKLAGEKIKGIVKPEITCNYCKTVNSDKDKHCLHCGRPINLKGFVETEDRREKLNDFVIEVFQRAMEKNPELRRIAIDIAKEKGIDKVLYES